MLQSQNYRTESQDEESKEDEEDYIDFLRREGLL